ncbi:uncharacterized protein LOC129002338 isoform X1 [Macrosteles quadrilineatus]|uniref:uncharacterized protein LOC129002338 isoform X1 n=1 Tax=Macrosteles quadrilineatus TaxID=74068 RepID=UPI0023E30FCB|nr:uncharacterized protein LOC129002338 isoform X1 [Macrosteles quadrilineatus]
MQFWDTVSSSALLTLHSDKPTQVKSLGKSVEIIKIRKTNSTSKTPHQEVQKTTGPRSKENLDEEAIAEAIKLATQSESETSKLLKEVSEEIEESIKKVFVTLNDQQEVVVVIDDQNRVIQELPTLQSIEAVAVDQDELVRTVAQEVDVATEELTTIDQSAIEVSQSFTLVPKEELTTIDQSAIEVSQSFTLVPKKKGRKSGSLNTDDYKFDSETNKYTCKKCGKNYTKKQSIVIHTHQCGKSQNIQTPRQSKQKGDGKSKTSKRSKIPPLEESVARLFTFDEVNNQWACKNCNKTCKSKQSVNTHKIKCGNQMKKCLYCEYVGRSPTAVRVHMMNQHKIIPRLNEDGTWIY